MGVTITLAQQKGGAGKTTVLVHLAHAWARAGRRVALVDLDPQRSLMHWAGLHGECVLTAVESSGWRAASDIREATARHDVTLVDCPGNASSLLEAAIRESDLVLVPCQPTGLDVWASDAVLKMAGREKTPARVVLNRVPPRGGGTADAVAALRAGGATVLDARLGNRVAYASGFLNGTTALGLAKTSAAVAEVTALAAELDALLAEG